MILNVAPLGSITASKSTKWRIIDVAHHLAAMLDDGRHRFVSVGYREIDGSTAGENRPTRDQSA